MVGDGSSVVVLGDCSSVVVVADGSSVVVVDHSSSVVESGLSLVVDELLVEWMVVVLLVVSDTSMVNGSPVVVWFQNLRLMF